MMALLDKIDKRILNFLVIILLGTLTFAWTAWIFHTPLSPWVVVTVIVMRMVASAWIFGDYALSWSKATPKTFLRKSIVYFAAFGLYMPLFYRTISVSFFLSELFTYLFGINLLMYAYAYYINRITIPKTQNVIIYGAGKAGLKLADEFRNSPYAVT